MARRNDHTREELVALTLDRVKQFLDTHSYHELSLRKVATMIGYVPSTLVNVFGNYNLLLLHVVAQTLDELAQEAQQAVKSTTYRKMHSINWLIATIILRKKILIAGS